MDVDVVRVDNWVGWAGFGIVIRPWWIDVFVSRDMRSAMVGREDWRLWREVVLSSEDARAHFVDRLAGRLPKIAE